LTGFQYDLNDNSELAYFLLGHPVVDKYSRVLLVITVVPCFHSRTHYKIRYNTV